MNTLEEKLGYTFENRALLENALTHSSCANESRGKLSSNERLEFLGDSILGMVVASPVVILMDGGLYTNMAWYVIVLSVVFLAAGVWIAVLFGEKPPVDVNAEKH